MKRKITDLEQKLYDNGWKLTSKTYCGKFSQFTSSYNYGKVVIAGVGTYYFEVSLDKKRSKVLSYRFINDLDKLDKQDILDIEFAFDLVEKELFGE